METRDFRSLGRSAQEELRRRAVFLVEHDGLSQGEAARIVGVERQAVNIWVRRGSAQPTVCTLDGAGCSGASQCAFRHQARLVDDAVISTALGMSPQKPLTRAQERSYAAMRSNSSTCRLMRPTIIRTTISNSGCGKSRSRGPRISSKPISDQRCAAFSGRHRGLRRMSRHLLSDMLPDMYGISMGH